MKYLEAILNKVEENKEEMLQTLQELIRIRSVVEPAEGDKPFGAGVQAAYDYMLKKSEEAGFEVTNVDNYGGHADLPGTSRRVMGIVGHLDVVPEGNGWDDEPYSGKIEDGYLYGRGTTDDKGPVVAAFYAMKALKECGIPMKDTVRLIYGLDEETDWIGMEHYLAHVEAPDYGFTPDGDFPAIHGEMGILVFDLVKKLAPSTSKGLELRSVTGGSAPNMVADSARAVVRDTSGGGYDALRAKVAAFREEKQMKINCKGVGKSFEITTEGIAAHGASPEKGLNAISVMMEFLGQLDFVNEEASVFVDFFNSHIGYELDGESLGCGFSDEPSGKLILNVGMIHVDAEAASLTVNVRYPVTMEAETVYEGIVKQLDSYNFGIVKGKAEEPIFIPKEDPMIETLMDIYKRQTGDVDSEPLVIGGGTYARAMDGIIAFGAKFPDEPDLMHQKNERISIDSLMKMTRIYAESIYRLAAESEN